MVLEETDAPPAIPRFEIVRLLGKGAMGEVYLAVDRERGGRVALKLLRNADPARIARLNGEFRILAEVVHPNLVQLFELIDVDGSRVFTMEPIDGIDFVADARVAGAHDRAIPASGSDASRTWSSLDLVKLKRSTESTPTPVPTDTEATEGAALRDRIARLRHTLPQLAAGIRKMHSLGKVHLDIKPLNVLVDTGGRVVVLDFGFARDVPRSVGMISNPAEGTPAFIAPEVLRGDDVGFAADWYAVGVMLYEALTGVAPHGSVVHELMLSRLCLPTPSPRDRLPDLPAELDRLCVGLMNLDPRSRLGFDAIVQWAGIQDARDVDERDFRDVLIGREAEIRFLEAALWRARDERAAQIVMVEGGSGIGKTVLVRHFLEARARLGAIVLDGRCHDAEVVPFNALDRIVDALVRVVEELDWAGLKQLPQEDIRELAQMFPVVGVLDPAAMLLPSAPDAVTRTTRAFRAFREILIALAEEREVILFVDDIQRADRDSSRLIQALLQRPRAPAVLFVGACRAEDRASESTLAIFDDGALGSVERLHLEPMTVDEVVAFAREVGGEAALRDVASLERLASEAGGVPFFVEQALRFGDSGRGEVESLAEVVARRIRDLEPGDRAVLEAAAVGGGLESRHMVLQVAGVGADEPRVLSRLRVQRMVRTRGPRFDDPLEVNHDRIREAVLEKLAVEHRVRLHLAFADAHDAQAPGAVDALEHVLAGEEPERSVAEAAMPGLAAVHHLHAAYELDAGAVDKRRLFPRLVAAGIVSRANGAYGGAVAFLRRAAAIADVGDPALGWRAHFELARALNLNADFGAGLVEVDRLLESVTTSQQQRPPLLRLRFEGLVATQQMSTAIDVTIDTLALLGIDLPRRPKKWHIAASLVRTKLALWGRETAQLNRLPRMTDARALIAMQTMRNALTATFVAEPDLFPVLVFQMVRTTLQHGLAPESGPAFACYGLVLSGALGQAEAGLAFGDLAQRVVLDLGADRHRPVVDTVCGAFLIHWCKPTRESFDVLRRGWTVGRSVGDLEWAGTSASVHAHQLWFAGSPLELVQRTVDEYAELIPKLGQARTQIDLTRLQQMCATLRGQDAPTRPWALEGRHFDAGALVEHLIVVGDRALLSSTRYFLALMAYWFGDLERASEFVDASEPDVDALVGSLNFVDFWFVAGLVRFDRATALTGGARRKALAGGRASRKKLARWAAMMPANFQHMHDLVLAAECRATGRAAQAAILCDAAIVGAANQGHLQHLGMAWEAAARLHAVTDPARAAVAWTNARDVWTTWGASALSSRMGPSPDSR